MATEVVDNFEDNLIQLIKNSDFLYDRQSEYYRDQIKYEQAWNEIGIALNVSGSKVKRRWGTLRQRFSREFKKIALAEKNGSQATSTWLHFKSMEWLGDHMRPKNVIKHEVDEEHSEESVNGEEDCSVPWDSEERTTSMQDAEPAPAFTVLALHSVKEETSSPAPSYSSNVSSNHTRSKRKRSQVNIVSHSLCKVSRPSIESPPSFPPTEDDISVFTKYLDTNFRALPRECYLKLEFGIQNLLHQAKMGALQSFAD